jgi:hypothetical protein
MVSACPLSKLENFLSLTSVTSQDLALKQGASRLQTSANLWTFSENLTSPLSILFPLLNPIGSHHCRVTSIILLPSVRFYSSSIFTSSLSLAFVTNTFSAHLLQATRCRLAFK